MRDPLIHVIVDLLIVSENLLIERFRVSISTEHGNTFFLQFVSYRTFANSEKQKFSKTGLYSDSFR